MALRMAVGSMHRQVAIPAEKRTVLAAKYKRGGVLG